MFRRPWHNLHQTYGTPGGLDLNVELGFLPYQCSEHQPVPANLGSIFPDQFIVWAQDAVFPAC